MSKNDIQPAQAEGSISLKKLDHVISQARRHTDRYFRLFHRAAVEDIKKRWLDLALQNDAVAAEAAKKRAEILAERRASAK